MRWQKMALLVLRRVGLCVGQYQMCHLCGWLKLFLKNVRWAKIKIQKCWLSGRLSDGSFVQSLVYVLFCRLFLLGSFFRLAGNVLFTQLIYDIRECKVSNMLKPLSSLYLMQKYKSHKINTINYYIFFENICIYACFAYLCYG